MIYNPADHSLQNRLDFKPPLPNALVQWLFYQVLPWLLRSVFGGLSVKVTGDGLARLAAVRGERCLLLPNHPSEWDPCVLFDMGRQLKEFFYFVAAREVFDYSYGLRGWLFQRLGVYSLIRGSNDRASFKTSMEVLSENRGRLVIFVEGEISNQNESLLPLEGGVVQLALMALNDVYKSVGKSLEALPSLFVFPVAIRYEYHEAGLEAAIDHALCRLERETAMTEATNDTPINRLNALATTLLSAAAGQYGYTLNPEISRAENVLGLSGFMLTKLEQILNLPPEDALGYLARIRRIRNLVDHLLHQGEVNTAGGYQRRLYEHQKTVLRRFYVDLARVVNFVAIYDGYLSPTMSTHRMVELIRRMEKEVFGVYLFAPPRTAVVNVMGPVDLKDHFGAYLTDKRTTLTAVVQQIERLLYDGLTR